MAKFSFYIVEKLRVKATQASHWNVIYSSISGRKILKIAQEDKDSWATQKLTLYLFVWSSETWVNQSIPLLVFFWDLNEKVHVKY